MTDPSYSAVGAAIRNRRVELGLTINQLAERSNTSYPTVSRLERGTSTKVGSDKIAAILEALDFTLDEVEQVIDDERLRDRILRWMSARQLQHVREMSSYFERTGPQQLSLSDTPTTAILISPNGQVCELRVKGGERVQKATVTQLGAVLEPAGWRVTVPVSGS